MKTKIVIIMIFTIIVLLLSGCTNKDNNNSSNEDNNNNQDDTNWLENYTPIHDMGNGSDDFWIGFPSDSHNYGQSIEHLNWILDYINDKCVLFVVHKTGCANCKPQSDRVIALAQKYVEQVEFYDLDIPLGGNIEQMANNAYLYDPDGPPGYIALTGIFTYILNEGEIKIGWHSWELDVEDSELESWIKDAIYYHNVNSVG